MKKKSKSMGEQSISQKRKKTLVGKIISAKMQNTAVVSVERKIPHKIYKKIIKRTKKYKADIHGMNVEVGDVVKIEETRPISRDKHFKVIEKMS